MSIATSAPLPTLLFAAVAALTVAGCGITVNLDDGGTERRVTTDTIAVGDLRSLDLTTENGTIDVRATDRDEITVESVLREHDEGDAEVTIDVDGDRLVIRGECDDGWFESCSVGFVVDVPAAFDVDVSTENGSVELIGVAGHVRIDSENGAIDADALASPTVEAHTDNGGVRLTFVDVPGSAVATTGNGSITMHLPDGGTDDYDVDAVTDNGTVDVGVRTDPESVHRITARSDNGSIDVGYRTT